MNKTYDILVQLKAQLQGIDGTSGTYNFELMDEQVMQGFVAIDKADLYPSICIPFVSEPPSQMVDQVTAVHPVDIELYGYVQHETDPLLEVAKLQSDMKEAIYSDETFDGNVWDLSMRSELVTTENFGAVVMWLSAKAEFIKST